MNHRDFLLTKINSGKAELEQMPAFMQMEREYLQADIKEWEEELAKIPPGPNGEKIYFLNRQINAAKDYLRRLHPRFEEERKQREEFIQEKEAELMKLEKENVTKTSQLEPCPFCGKQPCSTYYYESGHSIFCYNLLCKERPQVYCRDKKALVSMWNHLGDGLEADYKECQRTSCEGCEILGECENENQMDYDPWKYDCQIPLNPCTQCGTEPESKIEGDLSLGWVECPNCGNRVQTEENVTPEKLVYMWNEENPLKEERQSVMESSKQQSETFGPFKPCAKCGSPVEWSISFSRGDEGFVKCPRCGNGITFNNGDFSSVDEVVGKWNQANTKPEIQIPPKFSQVMKEIEQRIPVNMLNKLYLLNSILGLQRDEKGPVIEVKKIQETILEIDRTLQKGEIWKNDEAISELAKQSEKMKSDEYLAPSENRKIPIHGSVYVTALHIAGAVCRESERYAWEYEQKHGIEELSQVYKYLDQLAEWLFVRAEYLRETEECF